MPAIDLTRLERQITSLAAHFDDPAAFRRGLHDLLSSYHLYARKTSKENMPKSFMRHYNLPEQVVRQMELGLKAYVPSQPQATLALVKELWQDEYFEARDLAAFFLGQMPAAQADAVEQVLRGWLDEPLDRSLLNTVLEKAPFTLRRDTKAQWERFLGQLLDSPSGRLRHSGLLALAADLNTRPVSSYISVFKMLRPFFRSNEPRILEALLVIVERLAQRNPAETVYFLKQVLAESDSHAIEQPMRQYLGFFSPTEAASLREAVRNHAQRKFE